jgi:hypothetical protein
MKFLSACALSLVITFISFPTSGVAQQNRTPERNQTPKLVRTTMRHEHHRFAYGGTLTLVGAPDGSVTVEAWPASEVDISAEIQLRGDSEADLDLLGLVNTFVLDEDANHLRILTTGTHDKAFMRSVAKKFPRTLLGLPWKIDYRIRVPISTDLEINAGRGPISIAGVEGSILLSAAESETKLNLSGGTFIGTVATGKVNLTVPSKSWRGVGADIRVAIGEVTVELPPGFSGDLDAEILRTGQIVDSYGGLAPRETFGLTPQRMKARAGAGGASIRLTVGDGTINIKKQSADSKQQTVVR